MATNRTASWGHWGITFYRAQPYGYDAAAFDFDLPFHVVNGQGPVDGFLGSPLRRSYELACKSWREWGDIPVGALCLICKKWMYQA